MGRLGWVEVIFVFKMCKVKVERREAEGGFKKMPANFHNQRVSVQEEEK